MKHAQSYYCAYSLREKTVRATPDCHTEWGSVPFWGWGGAGEVPAGVQQIHELPPWQSAPSGRTLCLGRPGQGSTQHSSHVRDAPGRPWQRGWKNPPLSSPPHLPLRLQVLGASSNTCFPLRTRQIPAFAQNRPLGN